MRVFRSILLCSGMLCSLNIRATAEIDKASEAALREASRAVVLIISTAVDYHLLKYDEVANGILISNDGYIVTVSHGLTGGLPEVYVENERYRATVVYNDRTYDFAILKINARYPLPCVRLSGDNSINEKVYVVGKRKRKRELFMSNGILSVKGINMSSSEISWVKTHIGEKEKVEYAVNNGILHSAHFFKGLSGCPLLNRQGEVIAMNSGYIGREDQRITLAMELVCFLPVIESVMRHTAVNRTWSPCEVEVDLENPLERVEWIMNGLYQYTTLLGKDSKRLRKLRDDISAQAQVRITREKQPARQVIQWAWKTFLHESYAMK